MSQPTTSRHAAGTELTLGDIQELFEELWVFRPIRPPVPVDSGRSFRSYPATLSG